MGDEGIGRLGLAEIIALNLVTAEPAQEVDLMGLIDTLGHGGQAEAAGQRQDGARLRRPRYPSPPVRPRLRASDRMVRMIASSSPRPPMPVTKARSIFSVLTGSLPR